jgi:SNF2 family DNA or RNA helicase
VTIVNFDFTTGHFFVEVKDSISFDYIVASLKLEGFYYNNQLKRWESTDPVKFKNICKEILYYEPETKIDENLIDLCYDLVYRIKDDLKQVKKPVNKELLSAYPPLVGKHPYEDFQLIAYKKNIQYRSFIFDLDRGLGKSWIMIISLLDLYLRGDIDRALIVCRPEGVESTRIKLLHYAKGIFTENDIQTLYTEDGLVDEFFNKKVLITNYNTFRIMSQKKKLIKDKIKHNNYNVVKEPRNPIYDFTKWGKSVGCFLDEAQSIKIPTSLQSRMLHIHSNMFTHKYMYSGTLGFSILEYYSYLTFLDKGLISLSFSEFKAFVANVGTEYSDWAVKDFKEEEVKYFKEKLVDKFQLSYPNKDLILDLKGRTTEKIYVRMPKDMRKMYQKFVENFIEEAETSEKNVGTTILARFNYLTLFTSDPSLVADKFSFIGKWSISDNPKYEVMLSLLEKYIDEQDRKVIIWSGHPKILDFLNEKLYSKYKPIVIHGETKKRGMNAKVYRKQLLEEYKTNKECKVLLASYKVLYTSEDIFESSANIYWDRDSNPEYYFQSNDRNYRHGQERAVNTDILIADDSIEVYLDENILGPKEKTKEMLTDKKIFSVEDYKKVFNRKAS